MPVLTSMLVGAALKAVFGKAVVGGVGKAVVGTAVKGMMIHDAAQFIGSASDLSDAAGVQFDGNNIHGGPSDAGIHGGRPTDIHGVPAGTNIHGGGPGNIHGPY